MVMADTLVTTDWLAARLGDPNVAIVDASWYMPKSGRDADVEYVAAHIPGAVRFDIDKIADPSSDLPHTLAPPEDFARAAGALGISENMTIVAYDGAGLFSAARVWWNFRIMGALDVHVLDGGFPKWQAEKRPVESGAVTRAPKMFTAKFDANAVAMTDDVRAALASGMQVVDARSGTRFRGEEREPRHGVEAGHMPSAKNVHYSSILTDGRMKDAGDLDRIFRAAGVDPAKPMLTTCGSGITAAILALAVEKLGHGVPRLYDGSWAEWGGRSDTPKERG
jgi:thiosulfate/3-mercaptopyruvate sulfurtransferase